MVTVTGFVECQLIRVYILKCSFIINTRVNLGVNPLGADALNFAICVEKIIPRLKYTFSSNQSFQSSEGCIRKGGMFVTWFSFAEQIQLILINLLGCSLPWMFSPTVGKSKFSCTLSKIYFHDLEVSGNFGVPNRILRDTETGLFIRYKTGSVPG